MASVFKRILGAAMLRRIRRGFRVEEYLRWCCVEYVLEVLHVEGCGSLL